jgi:hypothetical protein
VIFIDVLNIYAACIIGFLLGFRIFSFFIELRA